MADYHKYVFDEKRRQFLGRFEEMYHAEMQEGFDSWQQEDMRHLSNQISLLLVNKYNFNAILDVGCGKGVFTHLIKKENNRVTGIDISKTALKRAQDKFSDIHFEHADITNFNSSFYKCAYDLIVVKEALSYLQNWGRVLEELSLIGKYILISLFIPENPIGFVKSERDLAKEVEKHFEIAEKISAQKGRFTIIFGRSRK
ncbi:class I SAM-dependent methyltransferase [Thermodesulfobacteriota bacterium]